MVSIPVTTDEGFALRHRDRPRETKLVSKLTGKSSLSGDSPLGTLELAIFQAERTCLHADELLRQLGTVTSRSCGSSAASQTLIPNETDITARVNTTLYLC